MHIPENIHSRASMNVGIVFNHMKGLVQRRKMLKKNAVFRFCIFDLILNVPVSNLSVTSGSVFLG